MGACTSNEKRAAQREEARLMKEERKRAQSRSHRLDRVLRQDEVTGQTENKLLFLGSGGAGKSTFLKQLVTIYGKGFSTEARKQYISLIHSNVVVAMRTLCQQCNSLGLEVAETLQEDKKFFSELKRCDIELTAALGLSIRQLWADVAIQQVYEGRSNFQLSDSAAYYFDRIDEVAAANYIPSEQDVLRSRKRTTGIIEYEFLISGVMFRLVDVGGQRNERKKWIHCFENVKAVIFVSGISEYDQVLYEDDQTNRLHDSLALFEEQINSRWFRETSFILFLNKCDLFKEKIKHVSLRTCFSVYSGADTYEEALDYIIQQFQGRKRAEDPRIYTHVTCAIDTGKCAAIFNAVKDITVREGLSRNGLM